MHEEKVRWGEILPVAIVAWLGALIEWIDFYTYAMVAKIIGHHYFPSHDPVASLLGAYAGLAIGFFFRPLGALMFGKIGDQFGRKVTFVAAVSLMMIGTLGIAVLPTYAKIGILATIGIILLRIVQGLALGGGFGAAITYLGEYVPDHRRGFITGFLFTTAALGIGIAANVTAVLQGHFGAEKFAAYGWRWAFVIVGIIVLIIAIIIHLFYKETPVFTALKKIRQVTSSPVRELFTNKYYFFLFLLAWIGVVGAHGPIWYTNQLYIKYYLQHYGISIGKASKLLAYATYCSIWAYPFFGWLSDKIGRRPILLFGIFGNALMFPITFSLIKHFVNPPDYNMLFVLTLCGTLFNGVTYSGAMPAFLLELFPARIRTTAIGFTYNMGYGITGGLTPLMITALYKFTGNMYLSVILWSTCLPILMGLFFLIKGWETKGTRLWEELSAGKFAQPTLVVDAHAPVSEVMKKMNMEGQRYAIVKNTTYLGIVEERRILAGLTQKGVRLDSPVKDIAVEVDAVLEDARIIDAIVLLDQYGVKALPVADRAGNIIGAIDPRIVFNEIAVLTAGARKPFTERIHIEEVMKSPAITVTDNTKIIDVATTMAEKNIGFLPVVSADTAKLAGVISEKDLMAILCCEEAGFDKPVKDYMITNVITVTPEETVKSALEKLISNKIRHLPVVKTERVIGVVSSKDLLKVV